jgi:hypothetical protein
MDDRLRAMAKNLVVLREMMDFITHPLCLAADECCIRPPAAGKPRSRKSSGLGG